MRFQDPFATDDVLRADAAHVTPRLYACAMHEGLRASLIFREAYLKPLVQGVTRDATPRQVALIGLHYRMILYLAAMLRLGATAYSQSLAATARSLFELGLDIVLVEKDTTDAAERVGAFTRVERYRSADTVVKFFNGRAVPRGIDLAEQSRLCSDEKETAAVAELLEKYWAPDKAKEDVACSGGCDAHCKKRGKKKDKKAKPSHWSKLDARSRACRAGGDWERRYVLYYPLFSWFVHAGLVGVDGMSQETFDILSAQAYQLSTAVVLDTYDVLGRELGLAQTMGQNWDRRMTFLRGVAALALVDDRLVALGEPQRFLYLDPGEEDNLRVRYGITTEAP